MWIQLYIAHNNRRIQWIVPQNICSSGKCYQPGKWSVSLEFAPDWLKEEEQIWKTFCFHFRMPGKCKQEHQYSFQGKLYSGIFPASWHIFPEQNSHLFWRENFSKTNVNVLLRIRYEQICGDLLLLLNSVSNTYSSRIRFDQHQCVESSPEYRYVPNIVNLTHC